MQPDSLHFYKETCEDWITALFYLQKFEAKLFTKTLNRLKLKCNLSHLNLSYFSALQEIKEKNLPIAGYTLFTVWSELRCILDHSLQLNNPTLFFRTPTKEERIQYEFLVSQSSMQIMNYRGREFIVDTYKDEAYLLPIEHNNSTSVILAMDNPFILQWDWWYLIDRYLDLEENWTHSFN